MILCDYGCGQAAFYHFKNGKWCCSKNISQCPYVRRKSSERAKTRVGELNPFYKKKHTKESIKLMSDNRKGILTGKDHPLYGKNLSKETKEKISKSNKGKCKGKIPWNKGKTYEELYGKEKAKQLKNQHSNKMKNRIPWNEFTIEYNQEYHPLFFRIEQIRYNPKKLDTKEIQAHCKNHKCKNCKEQGGWFTPTKIQIDERIRQIESIYGQGGCYFYCSDKCKNECPLYNLRSDPFQKIKSSSFYTYEEYITFRKYVLVRDNYICQYCGEKAEHVHHERPQKLEPFFALDPDLAWSVCKDCHYKYGHKDECSTGNLSAIVCGQRG